MIISIALIAAGFCVLVLVCQPERRKQYNEFHRPAATTSGSGVYGDTGAGFSGGGMGGGGIGAAAVEMAVEMAAEAAAVADRRRVDHHPL
jgi:hypothetical protein